MTDVAFQKCIVPRCAATYAIDEVHVACPACGGLLDVAYDWNRLPAAGVARLVRAEVDPAVRPALL